MPSRRSPIPGRPNALFEAFAQRRAEGLPILDLTESNPTRAGIAYDARAILAALSDARNLTYEPFPLGRPEARQAVAEEWERRGVGVKADRVVLTASTSEAYAYCFKLLCDPGDDVLVPRPSYPLFEELGRYEGVRLVPYDIVYDGAWHVDVASAREARGPRTRAVLVVNPNNPTGSCITSGEIRALADLGVPLVVDEVFGAYGVESNAVRSVLLEPDIPLIVLDGLSKLAGLPQMKIAWMTFAGPAAAVDDLIARLELLADAYLSVGTPAQVALAAWLRQADQTRTEIRQRLAHNLGELRAIFQGSSVTIPHVAAGWYAMARLPGVLTEEEWVLELLRRKGVLVHPGWFYDAVDAPWIVLSLLTPTETFVEGSARIRVAVDALAP